MKLTFRSCFCYALLPLLILTSCSKLLNGIYGIKQIDIVEVAKINQFYASLDFEGIETEKIIVDSVTFQSFRKHQDEGIQKDLSQPIQIHYFKNGNLESFHANCYAKGSLKNLDWNYQDRFESFIPMSAVENLANHPDLTAVNKIFKNYDISINNKVIIVIFWTRMLEEISKDAIELVLENIRQFDQEEEVKLLLINTDSFFSKI